MSEARGRGVTFADGFTAGAVSAGVKEGAPGRLDVALMASSRPCISAGLFTTNQVIAAPCLVTRRHLERGPLRAIVANSGNANACTGERGERDAFEMARAAARVVGISPYEVGVASTGVIGVPLAADRIVTALSEIRLGVAGWDAASRAIMTTDTKPKVAEREVRLSDGTVRIGGIAKGAGMIHPGMATLLAFVTTDARLDAAGARAALRTAAEDTFNAISVDGDMSTNDTLLLLANGASGVPVGPGDRRTFTEVLGEVCGDLARAIVADGEGATKVFAVRVSGAASPAEARTVARAITRSNLVKTAIHGADPNWGRILAAAGASGARLDARRATVRIGDCVVYRSGAPVTIDGAHVRALLERAAIDLEVDLGQGQGTGRAWGCDLSAEYVRINAEYTT